MKSESKIEQWKRVVIDGFETSYFVSDLGRLRNGDKLLGKQTNKNKYVSSYLAFDGKLLRTRRHRLVAMMFIRNPRNLPQVNHINGVKSDNRAVNLEWCTARHNIIHSFEMGLCVRPKGKESHLFDKGRQIKDLDTGITYPSVATAARALKIPRTTISAEINGLRPHRLNIVKI